MLSSRLAKAAALGVQLAPGQRGRGEPSDTIFGVGKAKIGSKGCKYAGEVAPALFGEMQAKLGRDEVTELRQVLVGHRSARCFSGFTAAAIQQH